MSGGQVVMRAEIPKGTLRKFMPVLVLAIAAVILIGVTGRWIHWVGSGATQKTDDAIPCADGKDRPRS